MTFEKGGKEICQHETEEEWRRLFYVAFTRASYLMILPWFPKLKPDKNGKLRPRCKAMDWYVDILEGFCKKAENAKFFDFVEDKKFKDRKESVRTILKQMQKDSETVSAASVESAAQTLKSLDVWHKFPHSTSYSQIAHGTQEQETDEGRLQKDEVDSTKAKTENAAPTAEDKYPRGAELGNAIHKIFELVDFEEVGKLVYATHDGLSKDYGVSCPELDFIVSDDESKNRIVGIRGQDVILLFQPLGYFGVRVFATNAVHHVLD
jgi:exodeoxyribonuclease V beta subunit